MGYGVAMSTRAYRHMSAEDRKTLSLGLAHGHSLRMMARVSGRAPSTMSREAARNTTRGRPDRACRRTRWRPSEPVSHGDRASAWTPGSGSMYGHRWLRAARPNRLLDASDASILTTGDDTSRQRPSMGACICCPAARCGAHGWRRCVRRTRRVGLGHEGQTDAVRSST